MSSIGTQAVLPPDAGFSARPASDSAPLLLGYVIDICDTSANRAAVARLCRSADVLFIEASFAAADAECAFARAHLTTTAAGEMARAAGARRDEPFHFSPRNEGDEAAMLAEVEAAFRAGD